MSESLRLLAIASRPSDYGEMSDLARALAARGHTASLLYLYSRDDPSSAAVIAQLTALAAEGVLAAAVEVSEIPDEMPDAVVARSRHTGPLRNESLVVDAARKMINVIRRLRLNLYPKNTVVARLFYGTAHFIDAVRDRERTRLTIRLFRQLRPRLRELPSGLRLEAIRPLYRAAAMVLYYRRVLTFMSNTIARRRLDAILLPEDIVGAVWPVSIHAAHAAGAAALVLPYTLADQQEAVQSLKGAAPFQSSANRVAAVLYPRWRYQRDGIDIVRLPSDHILAHEDMGLTPPDPWMMNSGFADGILVDSEASREYSIKGGIPPEQLTVVGSVSQDRMFELRHNRAAHLDALRRELRMPGSKPLLLISGCPNQLTAPVPFCEFPRIEDVAAHVGESLAPLAEHFHLVVRPHPNFLEFGAMLERYGVTSTTAPTASLVPLADVFIAFASATIRWAIACAVPAVNYDVFHYGYDDFAGAKGVKTVQRGAEFRALVRSLRPTSAELAAIAAAAQVDSAHWSVMDGHGLDRIEDEIRKARERRRHMPKEPLRNA
jgi:hypothetical protein